MTFIRVIEVHPSRRLICKVGRTLRRPEKAKDCRMAASIAQQFDEDRLNEHKKVFMA